MNYLHKLLFIVVFLHHINGLLHFPKHEVTMAVIGLLGISTLQSARWVLEELTYM